MVAFQDKSFQITYSILNCLKTSASDWNEFSAEAMYILRWTCGTTQLNMLQHSLSNITKMDARHYEPAEQIN